MENFSVIKDGKEYWISRSVAVACFVFKKLNKKWASKPNLKLLYSKYVWGNRQKVYFWNLKNKKRK